MTKAVTRYSALGAVVAVAAAALAAVAQGQGVCDPLVPESCLLPFPNNFWTVKDAATPTGLRVVFPQESIPADNQGVHFNPASWSRLDGFSPSASAMAFFPNVSLSESGVANWWDIGRSLLASSPTVYLEADTGVKLAHFAELDNTTPDQTEAQAFTIWPIQQLKFGTKHIVAIRNLYTAEGQRIQPSAAFLALRDGTPSSDPDVESRRAAYEVIFAQLEAAGVERASLLLAWEFTTASFEWTTKYIVKARDDGLARLPVGGPEYVITSIEENPSTTIQRRIHGEMTIPHYHTNGCRPGCQIVLDEQENPEFQGWRQAEFTVNIPVNCANGNHSACPILIYGHGLLGGRGEADGGVPTGFANTYGYIIIAVDMWGMCSFDVPHIGQALLSDLSEVISIPDRSVQGILNHHFAVRMIAGDFAADPAVIYNGRSVIDTTRKFYWGISQGGIYGVVIVATSTDIERGQLGVPGGPYPLLLPRSVDFDPYYSILKGRYANPFDRLMLLSLIGLVWDWAEPGGYMGTLSGPYQLGPQPKRIYADYALGDAQVHFLGAYMIARSFGAKLFTGNNACANETDPIYGFEVTDGPETEGSVLVGWDFPDRPCAPPFVNLPPLKEYDTHSQPRRQPINQQMADTFFKTGVIADLCENDGCHGQILKDLTPDPHDNPIFRL